MAHEASEINEALVRAELMSALGREIERVDRASAQSGMTRWAILGALAFIVWTALSVQQVDWPEAIRLVYFALATFIAIASLLVVTVGIEGEGGGRETRLAFLANTPAQRFSSAVMLVLASLLAIGVLLIPSVPGKWWIAPFSIFAGIAGVFLLNLLVPWLPVPQEPIRVERWYERWLRRVVISIAITSSVLVFYDPAWRFEELRQTVELKMAVLLLASGYLFISLIHVSESREKSANLRRLELELALGKSSVTEAKERFEFLMLGLTAAALIRPWVQTVVRKLDDAGSQLQESDSLLASADEMLSGEEVNRSAVMAVLEKAREHQGLGLKAIIQSKPLDRTLRNRVFMLRKVSGLQSNEFDSEISSVDESMTRLESIAARLGNRVDSLLRRME